MRGLSRAVARAGQGSVLRAKAGKIVAPTTLDMGSFGGLQGVSVEERAVHRNTLDKVDNFAALRINPQLRDRIKTVLFHDKEGVAPTPIQRVAIKALRKPRASLGLQTWLLAAETGSGKTLAYLAPLLSNLLEASTPSGSYVRSMVLVPTAELVTQVMQTAQTLAPSLRIDCVPSKASKGLDVLIASSGALKPLIGTPLGDRALPHCRSIVIDEADSLLNRSFVEDTTKAIDACQELDDLVFVSATIPRELDRAIRQRYPETHRLITPSIHRLPRHIEFRVVEVFRRPYNDSKELALLQALYALYHDSGTEKRVVVFVNDRKLVPKLTEKLKGEGYNAVGIDGTLDRAGRREALRAFISPPKQDSKVNVLVATDLVARGIDMQSVRNIILYDLPPSAADLIHRAGRTGRQGAKGRVILLVSKKESQGWVRGLQKIVRRGQPLA